MQGDIMTAITSNLGAKHMKQTFVPGFMAGLITLIRGTTASILSPSNKVSAALAASSLGAVNSSVLRKQKNATVREKIQL